MVNMIDNATFIICDDTPISVIVNSVCKTLKMSHFFFSKKTFEKLSTVVEFAKICSN